MNTMHRILPNFKKLGKSRWTAATVQNRHLQLKETFAKCEGLDAKINMFATDAHRASIPYFVSNQFYQYEDYFNEVSDLMAEVSSSLEVPQSTTFSMSSTPRIATKPTIQLSQINLPSFDGTLTNWEIFRNQFQLLIHRDDAISVCEKMHYLKTSLTGDALRALGHLSVTATNY